MTKLLEEAIAKVRDLSDDGQDEAAEILLSVAAKKRGRVVLDDETRAAVRRGVDQARRGEFVSDADMAALPQTPRRMRIRFTRQAQADLERNLHLPR